MSISLFIFLLVNILTILLLAFIILNESILCNIIQVKKGNNYNSKDLKSFRYI